MKNIISLSLIGPLLVCFGNAATTLRGRDLATDCSGLWRCEIECSRQCIPYECKSMQRFIKNECATGDADCGTVEVCPEGVTWAPTTLAPTYSPTSSPTKSPTRKPTKWPTRNPTKSPSAQIETLVDDDYYNQEGYSNYGAIAYDAATDTYIVGENENIVRYSNDFSSSTVLFSVANAAGVTITPNGTVVACSDSGLTSSTTNFPVGDCRGVEAVPADDALAYVLTQSGSISSISVVSLVDGTVQNEIWTLNGGDPPNSLTLNDDNTEIYVAYTTYNHGVFQHLVSISIADGSTNEFATTDSVEEQCGWGIAQYEGTVYTGCDWGIYFCTIDGASCSYVDPDHTYWDMTINTKTASLVMAQETGIALFHIE